MADPQAFSTSASASCPPRRPVPVRIMDWHEVYEAQRRSTSSSARPGRCMDCGIPFCHNGCPLGNLIPEWNDLAWQRRLARGDRAAARDEQLPGVHRPALPGALRDRLRAGHQPAGR